MPLNPPPTISLGLALVNQLLLRSDMSRAAEVTFALNCSEVPSPSMAQDVIDDFQANFNATWGAVIDSEVTIQEPTIRVGDGSTIPFVATAGSAAISGGAASTTVPPNVALLMKKTSGLGGRVNRGRTYFPFVLSSVNLSENGHLLPADVTAYNAAGNAFLTQLGVDLSPMCIAHKVFSSPSPPRHVTDIHTGPLVTHFLAEDLCATQRRRLARSS